MLDISRAQCDLSYGFIEIQTKESFFLRLLVNERVSTLFNVTLGHESHMYSSVLNSAQQSYDHHSDVIH